MAVADVNGSAAASFDFGAQAAAPALATVDDGDGREMEDGSATGDEHVGNLRV